MMTLKPFELGDHHLAGWDQRVSVGKGSRLEDFGEARIGSSFFGRIVRSSDNQALNHFPGVLDAISWDAATMSVTQKEASRLSKLDGIGSLGNTGAQQQEQGRSHGEIWTHGNSSPIRPP